MIAGFLAALALIMIAVFAFRAYVNHSNAGAYYKRLDKWRKCRGIK